MAEHGAPVEVALTIAATPATIFRYFTDLERFARWMGEASVLDPEPGGRLRVGYPTGQGAAGRVVAVEPGRRIVFSWGYEGDGQAVPAGSSTVEITLEPVEGGTEVRLRQVGLPAGEPPLAHLAGWRHTLAPSPTPAPPTSSPRSSASGSPTGWPPGTSPTRTAGRSCCRAASPKAEGSATRRPPSTAPAHWPTTSAWSSG